MTGPLRLLSLIFPSNYPNFGADSIYVFNRIMLCSLRELYPEVEITVAGPEGIPPMHPDIRTRRFSTGVDKFHVRFGFDWSELAAVIADTKPEVILVNMPEQTGSVSVLVRDHLRLPSRIVSYVHYVPASAEPGDAGPTVHYERSMDERGSGQLLVLRLLEGLVASDVVLVCSEFGVRLLRDLIATHLNDQVRLPSIAVLPPPVDADESSAAMEITPAETPTLVYNHRLYEEYGTRLVFSLLEELASRCPPFDVLVTNPTAGRAAERRRLNRTVDKYLDALRDLPFVRIEHFGDRSAYFRALARSWAGLAPYKLNALWSMSVIDLLAVGRPVLAFDIASFGEMGLSERHVVSSARTFADRLELIVSKPFDGSDRDHLRSLALRHSGRRTAERFLNLIAPVALRIGGNNGC